MRERTRTADITDVDQISEHLSPIPIHYGPSPLNDPDSFNIFSNSYLVSFF